MVAVDLEEASQRGAVVASPEAVGPEHPVAVRRRDERSDAVGDGTNVVGGGNDRPGASGERGLDKRLLRLSHGVQTVPTLGLHAVAAKLGKARHAPDIRRDSEVGRKDVGGRLDLAKNGPGAKQLDRRALTLRRFPKQVHPTQDPIGNALRHRGVDVVLVHHGQVVENVLLLFEHSAHALLNDDGDLVRIGRVVRATVRDCRGKKVAVTVLVLEALTVQSRAAGGAAEEKSSGATVASGPRKVTDALETEHRVEDVERQHRDVVV